MEGAPMTRFITVEEIPQYIPGELLLDSLASGTPDFRLRLFRYGPSDIWCPPVERFTIINYRKGATSIDRRMTGNWAHEHVARGVTTLMTRGEPSCWRWNQEIEVSQFYLSPSLMMKTASEVFDRDPQGMEFRDLLRIEDPILDWICDQMVQEVAAGAPGGRLYYDSLALQASVHILRRYASIRFKMPVSQGHFRPSHRRLIEDYIEQNIERNITIEELANACNCEPFQFSRKFRKEFEIQPHAYILRRKVEHACEYLRQDRLPLKDIALLSGFSDQSHLNRVFRRHLKITPTEFRKQVCGRNSPLV